MVHILLLILKVIGILLLILLGLVLAAAGLVLLVPVCYEAGGSWKDKPAGEGKISWLFGAVSLSAGYDADRQGFTAGIRLFGRKLWDMGGQEEDREDGRQELRSAAEKTPKREAAEERASETREDPAEKRPAASEKEYKSPVQTETSEYRPEPEPEGHKKDIPGRIKGIAAKLKCSFWSFCDKLKHIRNTAEEKKAWLEDEKNQASVKLLWKQSVRFLRHVRPGSGRGAMTFGFDDPGLTGQVLAAAAMIYPFFEGNLEICPVFDEKIFEAEGSFKGRVRAGYLLWLGLGILYDRHTRHMLSGFLKGSAV